MSTTIENLPMEVLEQILGNLDLQELSEVIWKVEDRWFQAVHNIICRGFCDFGPGLMQKLEDVKYKLLHAQSDTRFEDHELVLVAEYSFLQILNSEYKVIYSIFWDHSMNSNNTELICEAGVCLKEFKKLLDGSTLGLWNWRAENITTALDDLRNMNSKFIHHFFCHIWNPKEEKIGPLLLGIFDCSLNSNYFIRISHDENQVIRDAPCHICGHYEIQDSGNTLRNLSPDLWRRAKTRNIRILICNLCDTIRWGNLFYMLRLRWASMDNALAGRRREKLMDYLNQFMSNSIDQKIESEQGSDGKTKVIKILEKNPAANSQASRQGLRCEFQLWCTLPQAPTCYLGRQYCLSSDSLPDSEESTTCTRPYHFKMELKSCLTTIDSSTIENTIIWLEETAFNITINQRRETVTTT
ncbi:uncharacterized protein LOC111043313 [Nilaparvata lugens]|uniref:uncharacterized protein LOC111043313 n=1 Tax=Nilaparvata lugens TaxID=108931 RepID=UPI00193E3389|nr:uncharacterized protein LOC111043313 [Nilaparvata lugens]